MRRGFLLSSPRGKVAGNLQRQPAPLTSVTPSKGSCQKPDIPVLKFPIPVNTWISGETASSANELGDYEEQGEMVSTYVPPQVDAPPHLVSSLHVWIKIKHRILAEIPGFPLPFATPSPALHRIASTPAAGLGVFAATDLNPGDIILRERPLLITPKAFPTSDPQQIEAAIRQGFNGLPENLEALLSLANVKGPEVPEAVGRLRTNAFAIGKLPGYTKSFGGVARDISRVNHSCSPNAFVSWDLATFTFTLAATAPIPRGEQIFCSYLASNLINRKARREELLRKYSFFCRCSACEPIRKGPFYDPEQSDQRREYMFSLMLSSETHDAVFARWLAAGAPLPAIRTGTDVPHATENNALARAELLWASMGFEGYIERCGYEHFLVLMCKAHAVLQHRAELKTWATVAARLSVAFTGKDRGWYAIADAPEKCEWWGKDRARATLGAS